MKRRDIFYSGVAVDENESGSLEEIENEEEVVSMARFKFSGKKKMEKKGSSKGLMKILVVSFVFILLVQVGVKYLQIEGNVSKVKDELMKEK